MPVTALPVRALLVDDDPLLLALLEAFLQSRGYDVQCCEDGQQALAQLDRRDYNLVVTDRNMPRMDGLALARAIRARPGRNYIYVIMLTASIDEQSLVSAMDAGVDDFLPKPLKPAELGARLRAAERVLALEAGLASRNQQLTEAYAQLSRDLELARALQLGQLPAPQPFGGLRFQGMYEASSYVGGDVYDYFPLDGDLLAFYLADVSGHGVAAAMMAVHVQHQLRALSRLVVDAAGAGVGPRDLAGLAGGIVAAYNQRVLQMNQTGMYLTLAFGLLQRGTRQAALVHAGHPPMLLAGPGEERFTPIGEGAVPVGILPDMQYEARMATLAPGSRLVLYSDGVSDCNDLVGLPFGEQRLRELLARQRQAPLDAVCASARDTLRAWRGGSFEDDVTLLVVESA